MRVGVFGVVDENDHFFILCHLLLQVLARFLDAGFLKESASAVQNPEGRCATVERLLVSLRHLLGHRNRAVIALLARHLAPQHLVLAATDHPVAGDRLIERSPELSRPRKTTHEIG